jgi:hypothetical protein
MNFALDLFFTAFQGIFVNVFTAIIQVPLDVITAILTAIFAPAA